MKFQTFALTDDGLKALEQVSEKYILVHMTVTNDNKVLVAFIKPVTSPIVEPGDISTSATPITAPKV